MMRVRSVLAAAAVVASTFVPIAHGERDDTLDVLARVSDKLAHYYERAERVVATEDVTVMPLGADFLSAPSAQRYQFERRTEREAAEPGAPPAVKVSRRLLTVNGRPPRPNRDPDCVAIDSEDALVDLLAEHRNEFTFTFAGTGRIEGRSANIFDFRSIGPVTSTIEVSEHDCAHYDFHNGRRGRVWTDQATDDVLRYEAGLIGRVEFRSPWNYERRGGPMWMVLERYDETLRLKKVSFTEPDEELLLPASIETMSVFRAGGVTRTRSVQTFSNYRRFLGSSRLVE